MKIFCVGRNYVAHAIELNNEVPDEPVLVPARVALRAEENGALVVVHAVDLVTLCGEITADLGTDETGRTCD